MKSTTLKSPKKNRLIKKSSQEIVKTEASKLDGLDQVFLNKDGTWTKLRDILVEGDWWEMKSRGNGKKHITYIVYHDAVERIANLAGIRSDPEYKFHIQPTTQNNYTTAVEIKITDHTGRSTVNMGESSRGNLGARGRQNPINMAQKRAFDRAVFKHLGISGLLGDDELPDEPEEQLMDKISHEEKQKIAPLINEIFASKKKTDLSVFKQKMSKIKVEYSEGQLEVLRSLWKKQLAALEKSF